MRALQVVPRGPPVPPLSMPGGRQMPGGGVMVGGEPYEMHTDGVSLQFRSPRWDGQGGAQGLDPVVFRDGEGFIASSPIATPRERSAIITPRSIITPRGGGHFAGGMVHTVGGMPFAGGQLLQEEGGLPVNRDWCSMTCGDNRGMAHYAGGSLPYVGAGQGQYTSESVYKYVGAGAGDYGAVPVPPGTCQVTWCGCASSTLLVVVLIPVLTYLYTLSSSMAAHHAAPAPAPVSPPPPQTMPMPTGQTPALAAPLPSPVAAAESSTTPFSTTELQNSVTAPSTSSQFACEEGSVASWPLRKRVHCCIYAMKGCPTTPAPLADPLQPTTPPLPPHDAPPPPTTSAPTPGTSEPFDCNAGYSNWEKGWSPAKKDWCCLHKNKGCPPAPHASLSEPYDCKAGFSNWVKGWSIRKKTWCCSQKHVGCDESSLHLPVIKGSLPYDCNAAYANWANAWAPKKKEWCCLNKHMGCDPLHAAQLKHVMSGAV